MVPPEPTRANIRTAAGITAAAIVAVLFAPASTADQTTDLKSEIDAARSESGCPPLQSDAALGDVSQRISTELDTYVKHTARFLPVAGELDLVSSGHGGLLTELREAGYNTTKAKLLIGYGDDRTGGPGDNQAKAIKSALLQGEGFEVFTDCGYTKYGVAAINETDTSQGWPSVPPRTFAVADVVLAGD